MATNMTSKKKLTYVQQYLSFKQNLPEWVTKLEHRGFTTKATIQPTPLSECYPVRLTYCQGASPSIRVLNAKLKLRVPGEKIKHTYSDGSLCLYYPKAKEWTEFDYISESIVPWISVWLYYYEIWFATGDWLGGGIEH